MAGRGARLRPGDLAPRPGTPSSIARRGRSSPGPRLPRRGGARARRSRPPTSRAGDGRRLQRAAPTHSDEPRVPDLGQDHRLDHLARVSAKGSARPGAGGHRRRLSGRHPAGLRSEDDERVGPGIHAREQCPHREPQPGGKLGKQQRPGCSDRVAVVSRARHEEHDPTPGAASRFSATRRRSAWTSWMRVSASTTNSTPLRRCRARASHARGSRGSTGTSYRHAHSGPRRSSSRWSKRTWASSRMTRGPA